MDETNTATDRAIAALLGGALGDAMGMPTQLLSSQMIAQTYGFVDRFVAPTDDHPVSKGLPAGTVTDDTEQTLLLAQILLEAPCAFDHKRWVKALAAWERDVKERGSYDLLGPSTKRAIDAINNGVAPAEAGRSGDTNGAAMRIAPVGIMMPTDPLEALVDKVAETCAATHNTSIAISSAAAVAAAVSCGVSGGDWDEAIDKAIQSARLGAAKGHWTAGAQIAARIEWACALVRGKPAGQATRSIIELVGTSVASQEAIPAAFAVVEVAGADPWQAAVISANLGGDTDTIGAIAGTMAGACGGTAFLPDARVAEIRGIDPDAVRALAGALAAIRLGRWGGEAA